MIRCAGMAAFVVVAVGATVAVADEAAEVWQYRRELLRPFWVGEVMEDFRRGQRVGDVRPAAVSAAVSASVPRTCPPAPLGALWR